MVWSLGLDESEDEEVGPQTVRRRSAPSTPSSGEGQCSVCLHTMLCVLVFVMAVHCDAVRV